MDQNYNKLNYLKLLSRNFPNAATASTEIINLEAILNLPKGTEHFLADLHGEYEAFNHVLKNGSGSVKRKIDDVFANTMSARDKQTLATLIYYPREKMEKIADSTIVVPDTHPVLQPSLGVVPLQLFAYYVALQRGCDIDKPRNLAKSVTVE